MNRNIFLVERYVRGWIELEFNFSKIYNGVLYFIILNCKGKHLRFATNFCINLVAVAVDVLLGLFVHSHLDYIDTYVFSSLIQKISLFDYTVKQNISLKK